MIQQILQWVWHQFVCLGTETQLKYRDRGSIFFETAQKLRRDCLNYAW